MIAEDAPAKINLYLHVTGKRLDGYHLLDSLAVFAGVGDQLTVRQADTLSLAIDGPFATGLRSEPDNLVLRAARLLAEHLNIPARAELRLTKNLPVASGMGGGSADAAACLRALIRLWQRDLDPATLGGIAEGLGADVPVCLRAAPARMGGIGELLAPAPLLPPCGIALVNPGLGVSTPSVFRARQGPFSAPAALPKSWPDVTSMAAELKTLANDLEIPAISLCPPIAEMLDALRATRGARLARMSGSGATCFALYDSAADAQAAAAALARPGWWIWGGGLLDFTPVEPPPNDGAHWGVAKR